MDWRVRVFWLEETAAGSAAGAEATAVSGDGVSPSSASDAGVFEPVFFASLSGALRSRGTP